MKQSLKLFVLIMLVEFSQQGICNYAVIKHIVNTWTIHLKEYIKMMTVLKINALRIAMFKEEEDEEESDQSHLLKPGAGLTSGAKKS